MAGDKAEDEIHRRGIEGFDHPIIYEGKITGNSPITGGFFHVRHS
jgi:hypothetical protein